MFKTFITVVFGIWAGLFAYSIYYSSSSILNTVIILGFLSLFFYATRTYKALWDSIGLIQQPYIMALIFIFIGYYMFSVRGFSFWPTTYSAVGLSLIGFAFGTVLYAYWNIA
jgi:hypothetical protein